MNNNEILKDTWKEIDKKLSLFLNDYKKISAILMDEIQEIFNGALILTTEMYNYASNTVVNRFKRTIERNYNDLSSINKLKANSFKNRVKIKNKDIYEFLIIMAYERQQRKLDEIENKLFKEVSQETYKKEMKELGRDKELKDDWFIGILLLINARGYNWVDYINNTTNYNAGETFRQMLLNIKQGRDLDVDKPEFKKIFDLQMKRLLNKKTNQEQLDKYSGALDEEVTMMVNYSKLQAYDDTGIVEVRFIAEIDDKTTPMCETLNNQIFKINEWNTYSRYSDIDKKNIIYKTKGLQVGDNLPPINNHFHWCRSTITYQVQKK